MKTRAQAWSAAAFQAVTAHPHDKYRIACKRAPTLLHQCGLLQALVFLVARDEHGRQYVDDLARAYGRTDHRELITDAQTQDLAGYLAASRDLAELAHWFRRFAQIDAPTEDAPCR